MTGFNRSRSFALAALLAVAGRALAQQPAAHDDLVVYLVRPSSVDTTIHRFDEPDLVMFDRQVKLSAPLLVFLPGTGGRPQNTSDFAESRRIRDTAYRPRVHRHPGGRAGLSARARSRLFGEGAPQAIFGDDVTSLIDDQPEESVVNRLTKLLVALDRDHPAEGWAQYLANGQPNWTRIAVSGLSQGAGMAAYIAQRTRVARAILFSSPWDNYGPRHVLAPWVRRGTGATPPDDWFAAYHARENTAPIIAEAYSALRIPASHIRVFTLEPAAVLSANPYDPDQ